MAKRVLRAEQDEVAPSDVASPQAVDWPQDVTELRTTARQQRRSAWQKILAAQQHSGQSISTFCRTHQLAESTFYFWRKAFMRDTVLTSQSPCRSTASIRQAGSPSIPQQHASLSSTFVPVRVAARACGRIEIRLPDGTRIRVASPVDECALSAVLSALSQGDPTSEDARC